MFRPQTTSLSCPHCGFTYQASIVSIIDVQSSPELKQALLSGTLNASQCPNCRQVNAVATPLLYHDAENEFLGVFIPPQINLPENERQKLIGDMTKSLMDALPAEQRRGYMLTPQQFFTLENLAKTILGFDGITPEMIEASRRKAELVQKLAKLANDDVAFESAVNENKADLDEEFFAILGQILAATEAANPEEGAKLSTMRDKLLPLTETGQRILRQREAVAKLGENPTREQLLQSVIEGDLDQVAALAVVAQPLFDYQFFTALTDHIEQSSGKEREALEKKRENILGVLETLRLEEEETIKAAANFIRRLLQAEDMEQAVRENLAGIDSLVMSVLAANLQQAKETHDSVTEQRLMNLWQTINKVMEESLPPAMRLVLTLLNASYPDETRAILQEAKANMPEDFLPTLKNIIAELEAAGSPQTSQQARHLKNVLTQATLL